MIAFAPWQTLLDWLGAVLAWIYGVLPNYGVTIIVLTVVIRLVLLPLGIKQIRSMQHMQLVQPKIKQIQQKYKQDKQRQQEEIMKVYKEYGVNPFSGCWPVLLQFPILIAMYSVLRWPQHPIHVPLDSELYTQAIQPQIPETMPDGTPIVSQGQIDQLDLPGPSEGTRFLGMNLLCSAGVPWKPAPESLTFGTKVGEETVQLSYPVSCGQDPIERVPYYAFVLLMFGTTYFQQRQMQKASPPGAASQQQQALLKFMPLMFGVFGIFFPAGLVVYWTTSNAWQIGQQYFMLKSRPTAEQLAARAASNQRDKAGKKGFLGGVMERAEEERRRREQGAGKRPASGQPRTSGSPKPAGGKPPARGSRSKGQPGKGKPGKGKPTQQPDTGDGGGADPGERPER
jgi:YidC/Oxa1 family membrane protein insertase